MILGGIVAIGLGRVLCALPQDFNLAWYRPVPAFAAGVLLIAMGVYTIRVSGKESGPPRGRAPLVNRQGRKTGAEPSPHLTAASRGFAVHCLTGGRPGFRRKERQMASVRLSRYEATRGHLPRVCMRCGAPATLVKPKTFSWQPGWVFLFILLGLVGLVLFLVLSLTLSKRMRVQVPLCERHRHHWAIRNGLILGGLVLLLALAGGLIGWQTELGRWLGMGNDAGAILWLGLAALALIWLIGAAIAQSRAIRPTEITAKRIRLVGVSPHFVAALDEGLEEEEEEEEYEDGEPPRPRRRQAASGQFYDPEATRPRKRRPQPPGEEP